MEKSKRASATTNLNKINVVNRLKEIKEIIITNSEIPFKEAIEKIAKISDKTFYNYLTTSKKGNVSEYTITNFSEFFDLPKEIFTSEAELTDDIKNKMATKIQQQINNQNDNYSIDLNENIASSLNNIKQLAVKLNDETDTQFLQEAIVLLKTSLDIATNRLENLNALQNL